MVNHHKYGLRITFICFAGIALFLTFNKHSKSGYYNYHSEIWADKAGYYVYLPAALKYNFNPYEFPGAIDKKTGYGFQLNFENGTVFTKYTYGVALLQLPFFLLADCSAKAFNFEPNGFSPIYHWSINIASVFYLIIGFYFLGKYLKNQFITTTVTLVLLSLFLGTNLYYYSIDDTGMSHVYSFSLFCAFLYFLTKTNYLERTNYSENFLFGLLCGCILIIRPTNILFLSCYFFLDIHFKSDIRFRLIRILQPKTILLILSGLLLVILPQLLYWHYAHGSLLYYSYGEEGFNWKYPHLLHTWFSPNNGLFLYSPLYLVFVIALIYMVRKRIKNGVFIMILFLSISYVFSSWWDWGFGCAFGARNYVEYLAILSLPLAHLYTKIAVRSRFVFIFFVCLVCLLIAFNMKMIYSFDGCFFGSRNWDWNSYAKLVKSHTK